MVSSVSSHSNAHLEEVASVGDCLEICLKVDSRIRVVGLVCGRRMRAAKSCQVSKEQLSRFHRLFPEKWLNPRPESGLDRLSFAQFRAHTSKVNRLTKPRTESVRTGTVIREPGRVLIPQNLVARLSSP